MLFHRAAVATLVVLVGAELAAQDEPKAVEIFTPLEIQSKQQVPFVPAPALLIPIFCAPSGTIYVRLFKIASPTEIQDITSISVDGKRTVRFAKEKIYDVPNPTLGTFFATDSDVYIRVISDSNPRSGTMTIPMPDGTTEVKKTQVPGTRKYYIAHFKSDGTYVRSIQLDLPFMPRQIGAFTSGDFLVAGMSADSMEPRIALVKSNGQLLRFLDLKDDIRSTSGQFRERADTPRILPGSGTLQQAIDFSAIIPDGDNLVLVRRVAQAPVFVISPGGDVSPIKFQVPQTYTLFSLNAADGMWIAQYAYRDGETKSLRFVTYSLDRNTGKPINAYSYPAPLGIGMACTDGHEFTFLKKETDDTLTLVKAVPGRGSSGIKDGPDLKKPE